MQKCYIFSLFNAMAMNKNRNGKATDMSDTLPICMSDGLKCSLSSALTTHRESLAAARGCLAG